MAQKTCRFVILPQQERSSENPPPSKREFVRKGSPEAERARLRPKELAWGWNLSKNTPPLKRAFARKDAARRVEPLS